MPYRTVHLFTLYPTALQCVFLDIVTKHSNDDILLLVIIISNNINNINTCNSSRGFAKSNFYLQKHM